MDTQPMEELQAQASAARSRASSLHQQAGETVLYRNGLLPEVFTELHISLEELRVAEEELRQQNDELSGTRLRVEEERQRYQDLFDFAPDGYLVTDASGKILEANRAAGLLIGVAPRRLIAKPLTVYIATEARPQFRAWLNGLRQQESPANWETTLHPRRRPAFPVALTVSTVRDSSGVLRALRWLVRDATEQKAWEQRLQEANEALAQTNQELEARVLERTEALEAALSGERAARAQSAAILESITDAFYAVDENFRFTYVNREAEAWFGLGRADLIGRHFWTQFPQVIGSESHQRHLEAMSGQCAIHYEAVSPLTGRWIEAHLYPSDGGLSTYFRDISERKRVEQLERTRLDHSERIADALQAALMQTIPENAFPGLAVAPLYKAASAEALIGGDFYDAFTVDGGQVALVVGDVSGKGLAAAAHITEIKYALRAYLLEAPRPAEALARLNNFVCEAQRQDGWGNASLVVLALALLRPDTGEVTYTSAGAEPLLVLPQTDAPDPEIQEIGTRSGIVLGVEPGREYQQTSLTLPPGGMLLMTTDGITEARRGRDMLEVEGLKRLVRECAGSGSVSEISQAILNGARSFAGGPLSDDACILVAQRLPS